MDRPSNCTIDLTENCNLACDYCFTHSSHERRDIDPDMARRMITWFLEQATNKDCSIAWWGGEPLLQYGLIKELVPYAKEEAERLGKHISFGGTTNGVLYTPDKVEWLFSNASGFIVSLDGRKDVHDAHRKFKNGKGSWEIVDRNLREALKVNDNQKIRFSVHPDTVDRLYETVLYVYHDLGIKSLAFSPVYEGNWDDQALEEYEVQLMAAADLMLQELEHGRSLILKHLNDETHILDDLTRTTNSNPCGAGRNYMGWSVDGFGYPCHRFNKHGVSTEDRAKHKHIIARPVGDSWEWVHEDFRSDFVHFRDRLRDKNQNCKECRLLVSSGCNGGCYAVNWDLTGDMFVAPESHCRIQEIIHRVGEHLLLRTRNMRKSLPFAGWAGSSYQPGRTPSGCLCYNGCYMEGTAQEVKHINRQDGKSCKCYQMSYYGNPDAPFRTRRELDAQRAAEQRVMQAAQRMVGEWKTSSEG